jgi:hypothetical protein
MDIRKSVTAGLASILLGLGACSKGATSETNKFYEAFPNQLDGAALIERYGPSDSAYCLVHLRQVHIGVLPAPIKRIDAVIEKSKNAPDSLDKNEQLERMQEYRNNLFNETRSSLEKISRSQERLYAVLESLRSIGIEEIRVEGLEEDFDQRRCEDHFKKFSDILYSGGYFNDPQEVKEKYFFLPGAAFLQGARGNLRVKLTERIGDQAELSRRIAKARAEGRPLEHDEIKDMKERENYLLELISKSGEPYSIVIYGGDHDFRDNIDAWNNDKDRKFSLIVITPNLYPEGKK